MTRRHRREAVPPDLEFIGHWYRHRLPPPKLRWHTEQGWGFITALRSLVKDHGVRACADAMGITPEGVRSIVTRKRPAQFWPIPTVAELDPLSRHLKRVATTRAAGRQVRRTSREFRSVHEALQDLRRHYALEDIAAALSIPVGTLRRFEEPPVSRSRRAAS